MENQEEKFICEWCSKELNTWQALAGHVGNCKENPKNKDQIFKCQYCNRTDFATKSSLGKHEKNYCALNPTKIKPVYSYVICEKCGNKFNSTVFKKHFNACTGNWQKRTSATGYQLDHDDLFCKYCSKEYKTKNALTQHEIRCKLNPQKILVNMSGLKAMQLKNATVGVWCKGLTKETDERVALNALHVKETMIKKSERGLNHGCCTSEYWTDEKRQEQSDKKVALYLEHPEKHPNAKLAGNRKQMTYPEQLVYDWLISKNIAFNPQYYTDSFDNHHRWVDFYLPTYNLYIEIDGEHWHKESETDKLKDKFALEVQGITTLRIPAKSRIIETLESYFENLS